MPHMSISILARCATATTFFALTVGCGSAPTPLELLGGSSEPDRIDECKSNRRACIYEGSYDRGERDYAEEEAKRLNQAQLRRIRSW